MPFWRRSRAGGSFVIFGLAVSPRCSHLPSVCPHANMRIPLSHPLSKCEARPSHASRHRKWRVICPSFTCSVQQKLSKQKACTGAIETRVHVHAVDAELGPRTRRRRRRKGCMQRILGRCVSRLVPGKGRQSLAVRERKKEGKRDGKWKSLCNTSGA